MTDFTYTARYAARLGGHAVPALCVGARVRLYEGEPSVAGASISGDLIAEIQADTAGRAIFPCVSDGPYWIATQCPLSGCTDWRVERVCVGCNSTPEPTDCLPSVLTLFSQDIY